MFTGFYTTNTGYSYIANAVAGKTLVLTRGQFGDGVLPENVAITSVTELTSPLGTLPISRQSTDKNCVTITTQFSNNVNGTLLPPFHFMEAGLWGKLKNEDGTDDENAPEALLFYANALSKEKADYIPGGLTEFIINWPLTISEASTVTVEMAESLVYMTLEDLNLKIASQEEAIAGTDNTKMMTPLRVSNYVDKILGDINIILDTINGEVI